MEIKFDEIPNEARIELVTAASDLVKRILSQPGGREALDKKKAEIAERRNAYV